MLRGVQSFNYLLDIFTLFFFLHVYLTLCCALIASAVRVYLHLLWNIGSLLATFANIECTVLVLSTHLYEEVWFMVYIFCDVYTFYASLNSCEEPTKYSLEIPKNSLWKSLAIVFYKQSEYIIALIFFLIISWHWGHVYSLYRYIY